MSTTTQRRVARALRPGGPEVIEVGVEDLAPLKAGEALVEVAAAGLNHAETLIRSDNYTVRLPFPHAVGSLVLAVLFGAAVFAALGVATASLIHSADGSSAVVNFILIPMGFLTGSFGPTRHYPAFLRAIGDVLPLKYFIQIMNAVYLHKHAIWTKGTALGVLAAWGATALVVAALKFRWEPREA